MSKSSAAQHHWFVTIALQAFHSRGVHISLRGKSAEVMPPPNLLTIEN